MSRLRAILALCAVLSLLAPAVTAAGVEIHLQWGGHHGDLDHTGGHDHPAPRPDGGAAAPALDHPGHHSHAAPDLKPDPATLRETRRGSGDPDRVDPPAGPSGLTGAPGVEIREGRKRPPDPPRPVSSPALIHLHCALLL